MGYTQKDVARVLGCSEFEIIRHEQGRLPNLRSALKLELLYGVPVERLFAPLCQTLRREVQRRRRRLKSSPPDSISLLQSISINNRQRRVLALDPWTKAIGIGLLSGGQLFHCGVRYLQGPLPDRLLHGGVEFVAELLRQYRPHLLVLPSLTDHPGRQRSHHVRGFCHRLNGLAQKAHCKVVEYEAVRINLSLIGDRRASRQMLARAVAEQFPELRRPLPPPRKPWQSQDLRLSAYYAVSLGLTAHRNRRKRPAVTVVGHAAELL